MKKIRKTFLLLIFAVILTFAISARGSTSELLVGHSLHWNDTVAVEAGTAPGDIHASDFIKNDVDAVFSTDIASLPLDTAGEYSVNIEACGITHASSLIVEDTTPPTATAVDVTAWNGNLPEPTSFVTAIADCSPVTVSFKAEPDAAAEKQPVTLVLTDAYGNSRELSSTLTMLNDTEPPQLIGVEDKLIYIGDKVLYKDGVTVTDNRDETPGLKIDTGAVNPTVAGAYTVTYTATDKAGNITERKAVYTFREKDNAYVDEETMYAEAQKVLDSLHTETMTKQEKTQAVYHWVRSRISYRSIKTGDDWVKSAYDGLTTLKGDCYVYCSVSRALLTLAGVDNIVICNINKKHYWNMVNCGNGWYHFDTTPFIWGGTFCMVTDDELLAYSKAHNNTHLWDTAQYPATPKERPYE